MAMYVDWRSPGDEWIQTEFGWRRFADITTSLQRQLSIDSLSSCSSRSSSLSSSRRVSGSSTPVLAPDGHQPLERAARLVYFSGAREIRRIDKKINKLHLLLDNRCVSARSSSKESSNYCTIADVIVKLNFEAALTDSNYFAYICKVISLIFTNNQTSLSGTVQNSLLRMMNKAKEISIQTTCYTGPVLGMLDSAVLSYNRERTTGWKSSYALRNIDSKIKTISQMKTQLQEYLSMEQSCAGLVGLMDLPNEIIIMIAEYLTHPRDLLNFGAANWRLHTISEENDLWKKLTQYQHGALQVEPIDSDWKGTFITLHRSLRPELRDGNSAVACFCSLCNVIFWKSYGHPCLQNSESDMIAIHHELSPQQFASYFNF